MLHSVLKIALVSALQCAFPDHRLPPSRFGESFGGLLITDCVGVELLVPELWPGFRPAKQIAFVPVPETAVYEDDRPKPGQDNVRPSGQVAEVEPVAKPRRVQGFADHQFGLRVTGSDRRHVAAARSRVMNVGHASGSFALPGRLNQSLNVRLHYLCHCPEHRNRNRVAELLVSLRI